MMMILHPEINSSCNMASGLMQAPVTSGNTRSSFHFPFSGVFYHAWHGIQTNKAPSPTTKNPTDCWFDIPPSGKPDSIPADGDKVYASNIMWSVDSNLSCSFPHLSIFGYRGKPVSLQQPYRFKSNAIRAPPGSGETIWNQKTPLRRKDR